LRKSMLTKKHQHVNMSELFSYVLINGTNLYLMRMRTNFRVMVRAFHLSILAFK